MSALALAVGLLPTVLADEVTSTKPEITVVAKRITGEDNYMEISLEVNGLRRLFIGWSGFAI